MRLASLRARIRSMGFEGPYYGGLRGKFRFLFERVAWRQEIVFLGTCESFVGVPRPSSPQLKLRIVTSFDGLEALRAQLDAQYYDGFLDTWRRPFGWGEHLALGLLAGEVAAFAWVQRGNAVGFATYYGRLLEGDARILRVGVVPAFRRQGVNSAMMYSILERLIGEGSQRVFAESHRYNLPSVRTFQKVGFRAIAALTVFSLPGGGDFVHWRSAAELNRQLRDLNARSR